MKVERKLSRLNAAIVMIALPLILAACGGGGVAATPTPGHSAAPTVAATATVVPTAAGTPGATSPSSSVNACALLTVAEVAAAVPDAEITTATPTGDINYAYCKYSGYSNVMTFVTVDATAAASYWGTIKVNAGQPVAGVGDEGWWSTDSFQPGLYFMKGGVLAFISGSQFGPEQNIIDLGKLLASRM